MNPRDRAGAGRCTTEGAILERVLDATYPVLHQGLSRRAFASADAALRKTAWAPSHRRRYALVEGAEVLANAERYDLIGMLGRQAVRICAISAVSGDPAHSSSEPARVLVGRLVDDAKQHGADMAIVFVSPESTWVTLEGFADRSAERRASGKLNDKTAAPRRRAKRSFMDTELPCELIERTQL